MRGGKINVWGGVGGGRENRSSFANRKKKRGRLDGKCGSRKKGKEDFKPTTRGGQLEEEQKKKSETGKKVDWDAKLEKSNLKPRCRKKWTRKEEGRRGTNRGSNEGKKRDLKRAKKRKQNFRAPI